MDETDIALEAGREDAPHTFVATLVECRFLKKTENGVYTLHDWDDHQDYVVHVERRKAQARNAAEARWKNRQNENMPGADNGHANSNAPSLSPDPVLLPAPEPVRVAPLKENI